MNFTPNPRILMNKIVLTALSVLAVAGYARAQAETPVVETKSESSGRNYISVGPAYGRVDYHDTPGVPDDLKDYFGVVFNYGRYFGESSVGTHEIGVQAGFLGAWDEQNSVTTYATQSPLVAVYNYNFKLGDSTILYVGPRAGFVVAGFGIDDDNTNFRDYDTDIAFRYGAGIGIKQKFTKHFGMAVGYEYSRTGSTSYSLSDSGTSLNASVDNTDMHLIAISAAWTF